MKVHRTIRYRLHPGSNAKHAKLFALAGACRFVWNEIVGKLRSDYRYYGSCNPYCRSKRNKRGLAGTQRVFKWLRDNTPWLRGYSFAIVQCGHRDNADINAALNILAFGNGAAGRGGGGVGRPVKRQIDTEVLRG